MDFAEKYRPRTLSEVRGNRKAIEELRNWAQNWPSEKLAALLYGRPGTGKTSSAVALANDMGWQLLELNASDKRTQGIINATAGEASKNASLANAQKLILLDEIDNLHGTSDRGGAKAVTELVKKTREPVLLTANDLYGVSPTLRGYCKQIAFFPIREESAQKTLLDIWHNERRETIRAQETAADLMARLEQPDDVVTDVTELKAIRADIEILAQLGFDLETINKIHAAESAATDLMARLEQPESLRDASKLEALRTNRDKLMELSSELGRALETLSDYSQSLNTLDAPFIGQIAKNAKGDLRSAINDFQACIGGAQVRLVARDRSQSAFELVRSVFGDKDSKKPLNISYAVDETPEDLVHWIDENAPRALDGKRLSHAFQTLSRADIFLGRTRKRQNYGLWKYAAELMTSGVNIAARQNHGHYNAGAKYSPPTHWMRLGQTRLKRGLRDAVASKIASVNHVSVTKAREEIFPLYKELALRDPAGITATLTLSADELAFLMGVKKDTPSIKKALEEAGRLTNEQTPQVGPISKHEPEFTLDSPTHRLRNGFTTTPETSSPRTSERTASASDKNGKTGMKRPQRHLDEF